MPDRPLPVDPNAIVAEIARDREIGLPQVLNEDVAVFGADFLSCELRREALMLKMRIIAGFEVAEILMLTAGVLLVAAIVFAI